MMRVGFVGWRGMVGSVLMERMEAEGDFKGLESVFFTTSQKGKPAPKRSSKPTLEDAFDIAELAKLQVIVTCQGGDYTKKVHPELRKAGWQGIWIDAASALRMADHAMIALDPLNGDALREGLRSGVKDFIGGNCTVSLMLMGLAGLYAQGWVEWISSMTYQSASGAGAKNLRELVSQMDHLCESARAQLDNPQAAALELDRAITEGLAHPDHPTAHFGTPLAASLIPWIDRAMPGGETREEWKAHVESNKILGLSPEVPVDGVCVRVGAMRCHSQALTVKLRKDVPLDEIEDAIAKAHAWVQVVPNDKQATLVGLSPAKVSGTLDVPVGRLRKMRMGPDFLAAFTVGDQLLWGAAEPLRRMLDIVRSEQANSGA